MARMMARFAAIFAVALAAACNCDGGTVEPIDARLVVSPDIVDLGAVPVGLAGRTELTLENTGLSELHITGAQPNASLAAEVALDGVPAGIFAREKHIVSVVFLPTARGPREGELVFTTDSRLTPEVRVPVVGIAVEPRLVASPSIVDFGRLVLGEAKTATVTVENSGDRAIEIASVSPDVGTSPEFRSQLGPSRTLEPGGAFELTIAYMPVDIGFDEGRIVVADDTELPTRLGIRVRGEGLLSELEIDPSTIAFSGVFVGETRVRAFDLRNRGSRAHVVTRLELAGTASTSEFRVESSTASRTPFELEPGESRRVRVSYTPIDDVADADRIFVESTGLANGGLIQLAGRAAFEPHPKLSVSPLAISFGPVQVGTSSKRFVRIENLGSADLHLFGSVALTPEDAPFVLSGAPRVDALFSPLDSHELAIEFHPSAIAVAPAAELVIASDDPRGEVRVRISGEGTAEAVPDLVAAPAPIVFGHVPRATFAVRTVLLWNFGSAPLEVSSLSLATNDGALFSIVGSPDLPFLIEAGGSAEVAAGYLDLAGLAGEHAATLEIASDDPGEPLSAVAIEASTVAPLPGEPELSVAIAGDAELHLIRPGGAYFDRPSDCCWCSPNPDWGLIGWRADDPFLDVERIELRAAQNGAYRIAVSAAGTVTATVTVRSQGRLLGEYSRALWAGSRWDVGTFEWAGASGTFEVSGTPLVASERDSCF